MMSFMANPLEVGMELDQSQEYEIKLLRRIGQGDRKSFSELYDRFSRPLFATAYAILRNQELTEDVIQEVFVQIWQKSSLFNPGKGKPLTWAMTLTRNRAIDRIRSLQRRSHLMEEVHREAAHAEQFDDRNSFQAVSLVETGILVREALQKLPEHQRQAIELAFMSRLTLQEVAERLNEPLGTIKARIRRGLLRLRSLLPKEVQPD
jgi:RNA polymerase sigma-70 factor, ECF subfamily